MKEEGITGTGEFISPHKEIYLSRLRNQHKALEYILHDISEEQMRRRPEPSKWSIYEHLAHLTRYQEVFEERLHRLLEEDGIKFGRYNADHDHDFAKLCLKPVQEVLNELDSKRDQLIGTIESFNDSELKRTGVHYVYGKININGWIELFLLHEAHHFNTIFRLTGSYRK